MKLVRLIFCFLLVGLLAAGIPGLALAQEEGATDNTTPAPPQPELISAPAPAPAPEPPPAPGPTMPMQRVELLPTFPTVEAIAGGQFGYEMELLNIGGDTTVFDLRTTAPPGWDVYMTPRYEKDKKISSISLKPSFGTGETILVMATAPFWPLPDPGDYTITIEAVAGDVHNSVDLTARITARYIMDTVPVNQRYNTVAQAGKDNTFSINVRNLGSDEIGNIKFTTDKPDGWAIDFSPETIDTLEAIIGEQTVDLNIQPPPKTIAGDYVIKVRAAGTQTSASEIQIRVTVETPTIWGWVGVAIIVVVVAGLAAVFMKFSRR